MDSTVVEAGRQEPKRLDVCDAGKACRIIGGDESPINQATLYRGVKDGRFPAPIRIGGLSRWVVAELEAVKAARIAERDRQPEAA